MPADGGPRSPLSMKRQYTVSDKVRAANRRNLEKANAVPKAVRYRPAAGAGWPLPKAN